jgi:hypothetical protein
VLSPATQESALGPPGCTDGATGCNAGTMTACASKVLLLDLYEVVWAQKGSISVA